MDQKQFEARLVALDADYQVQKADIEDQIRNLRIELENELAIHDNNVHDFKVKITIKESVLSGFRKEYMRKKAELYYEFAKEQ